MKKSRIALWLTLVALLAILCVIVFLLLNDDAEQEVAVSGQLSGVKVVIDAGHGGWDSGTLGINTQVKESDINLEIAKRLQAALEQKGVTVVMTRSDENAIGKDKDEDMSNRRAIIEESGQDVTISIHQNRFQDESVYGPQVFYAPGSAEGEKLAAAVQAALNSRLEIDKPRTHMEGNYYIVKSGAPPAVIVECGFLSNPQEEVLLTKAVYQNKIVQAIMEGVEAYLS